MKSLLRAALFLLALSLLSSPSLRAAEAGEGFLGFVLSVDVSGVFNPTLNTAAVKSVVPSSPAARAGIAAGDEVIAVEGHPIAGAKAKDIQPLMHKQVGQSLHLRLKRPAGKEYDVTLVAVTKPPRP